MKAIKFFMVAIVSMISTTSFGQSQTDTIKVFGNCSMCKKRIEKAVKLEGVINAVWSPETKLLIISYDIRKISNDDIQKAVAAVGHDTDKYTADDVVYSKLRGCCLYERKKTDQEEKQ
jgi:mercuric ion binding protein